MLYYNCRREVRKTNERIKEIRNYFGVTQQEFAERIKVKRNTVATYEMGRSIPSDAAIALICKEYGIREIWLRTGVGEMLERDPKETEISNLLADIQKSDENDFKSRLISALARLDAKGWESLEKLVDMISEK